MFNEATLKKLLLSDSGKVIGIVSYNPEINFKEEYRRPFIRNGKVIVDSIGRVNYNMLDTFIVTSLNDYYSKIYLTKDEDKKNQNILTYQELYNMWQNVVKAKNMHDINLNAYYDGLLYRLYLLGYHN